MSTRSFAITADDKPLTLDDKGSAELTVNVSNTSAKPIRGQAKLVPLGTTRLDWLRINGEVERIERNFAANEAQQFVIRITPPSGTPPGKYSFRVNVMSVQNPDDDYAEGPVVSFEVRGSTITADKGKVKPFPWFYIILGVILLAGGVAVWWLMQGKASARPEFQFQSTRTLLSDHTNVTITAQYRVKWQPEGKLPGDFELQEAQLPAGKTWADFEPTVSRLKHTAGQVVMGASNVVEISRWEAIESVEKEIREALDRINSAKQPTKKQARAGNVATKTLKPEGLELLDPAKKQARAGNVATNTLNPEGLQLLGPAVIAGMIRNEVRFDLAAIFTRIPTDKEKFAPFYLQLASEPLRAQIKVQDEHSSPERNGNTRTFSVLSQSNRNRPFQKIGEASYEAATGILDKLDATFLSGDSSLRILIERR